MYHMPAEWEPHERTWMAWPAQGYMSDEIEVARDAWAAVANAIVRFEPLTMVVDPRDVDSARALLDAAVHIVEAPLDDAWMRDMGPTFVHDDSGSVAAVDWVFNGWGAQHWAKWDHDSEIAPFVAATAGVPTVASPIVNEGGGIHVDGAGTVLLTKTVQLDPQRNPGLTMGDVEIELTRTLGATRFIWFERGLHRDYDDFGTRGHVDIVACFSAPGTVLYHDQRNPEHPDYEVSREVRAVIDAAGLTAIPVPAPDELRDEHGFVDYSYINHYVCNGAVILCGFDDPGDARAKAVLEAAYPGREIVVVDAREIFARGGGIHCITQQQPSSSP